MMGKPTAEELELLTDEEKEALEIDENATDEDEEPEVAEAEDEEPEVEDEEPEPEVAKGEEEPPAEEQQDIKVDFKPKVDTKVPDDLRKQVEAEAKTLNADLEKQVADLKEKYDEGEIDTPEYVDQASQLRDQMQDNRAEVRDTMYSQWRQQQEASQRWEAEQDAFFKLNPQYDAPRYNDKGELEAGNPVMYGALDAACQQIARQNPNISGIDLLVKAKSQVDAELGRAPQKQGGKPQAGRPKNTNLGDLPAAKQEDAGAGQFSHLDKLTGDKLEAELEKLPAEQRERYLAGA